MESSTNYVFGAEINCFQELNRTKRNALYFSGDFVTRKHFGSVIFLGNSLNQ
jgi:hypothetical protein